MSAPTTPPGAPLLLLLAPALAADLPADLESDEELWARLDALDARAKPGRPVEPPGWVVEAASVQVSILDDYDADVVIEYRFRRLAGTWQEARLAGPELIVTRAEGPVTAGPGGVYAVLPPEGTVATARVQGHVVGTRGAATLRLLPGARAQVTVTAPGYDVDVDGAIGGTSTAGGKVDLHWRPHVERTPQRPAAVVLGEASVAGWESEGALQVAAKVRWRVARGELGTLRLSVGALDELDVTGAIVGGWRREGRDVVITPVGPVTGLAEVMVRGRLPLPADGSVDLPAVGPADARRVERYWTLGRPEEVDAIPTSTARLTSPRALPGWARGLSEAPPVAAWQGDGPVRLKLARYEPLMGPDTVVESAEFVLATSAEGRDLLRSTWLVRNERSQYLHVRPSEGYRPLTARVSGDPVSVLSDGDGGLYVPLEKSVETMQGLVSFPVEVTWIGEGAAWEKAGERAFVLPAVDAPIQAASWSVHLPRDVESRDPERQGRRGGRFGRGGLGASGVGAGGGGLGKDVADLELVNEVDQRSQDAGREAWLNALDAYKNNEFEDASRWLDVARDYVPTDSNVQRLQSNLDVLLDGPGSSGGEDAQARRIRDLANAKTVGQQVEADEAEKKAEEALREGNEEEAERYYQQVVDIAQKVAVTEQRESTEQQVKMDKAKKALSSLEARKERKAQDEPPPPAPPPPPAEPIVADAVSMGPASNADGETNLSWDARTEGLWGLADSSGGALGGDFEGGIVGGVEGGVEGGVVGGTIGGVLRGAAGAAAPSTGTAPSGTTIEIVEGLRSESLAFDPEQPQPDLTVDEEWPAPDPLVRSQTISGEFLSRIPTGRTYQSAVESAPGVTGRGRRGGAKGEADLGAASTVTNKPAPARAPAPASTSTSTRRATGRVQADDGDAFALPMDNDADGILDEKDVYDPDEVAPPAPSTSAPTVATRAALVVTASPFTPALPLDGALVTHASALLPAGAFPTFTIPYRTRGN